MMSFLETTANGAIVVKLQDVEGQDILSPRCFQETVNRERGGCHVCFPQFGPDVFSQLPQHGFGRDVEWKVIRYTDTHQHYRLQGQDQYEDVFAEIIYSINAKSCTMALRVDNKSNHAIRCAPGFHPYYLVKGGVCTLNGRQLSVLQGETVFIEGEKQVLETDTHRIWMKSNTLTTWAVWSDMVDQYICIEPTLRGNAFLSKKAHKDEIIEPSQQREYQLSIEWHAKRS